MVRRGPPPKGHKARARTGKTVGGGKVSPQKSIGHRRVPSHGTPRDEDDAGARPLAKAERVVPEMAGEAGKATARPPRAARTKAAGSRSGSRIKGVPRQDAPEQEGATRRTPGRTRAAATKRGADAAPARDVDAAPLRDAGRERATGRAPRDRHDDAGPSSRPGRDRDARQNMTGVGCASRARHDDADAQDTPPRTRATRHGADADDGRPDYRAGRDRVAPAGPQSSARRRAAARPDEPPPLPSKTALRQFLAEAGGRVTKSTIARAFGLTSDQRQSLRMLMREIAEEGGSTQAGKRGIVHPSRLPEMAPVEITGTDPDGDPIARPVQWQGEGRPPIIYMRPEPKGQPALTAGERVLARLKPIGPGKYEGRTFKRIGGGAPARILGVFEEGRIIPTDRRQKGIWQVDPADAAGAKQGEIVLAEPLPSTRHFGPRPARITEVLGVMGEPRSVSLVCIHAHGIPDVFPAEAVQQAEKAHGVTARGRTDLRDVPLVTIDGEDARDFDDAVFAEPDGSGWRVLVAIADVAHYVTTASALDREAWARGNSVYFPDRVVPMLPEALSNGWCSLRPNEERGCLFVEMRFDAEGRKQSHQFGRGIMRSAARLTYEQVQEAADAGSDPASLAPGHVGRLYGAFRALLAAREKRGTLDLDVPERRVMLDAKGNVQAVVPRARLDAHRLIEEFMVAANVCAAEELERLVQPCMYRVHDRPSDQKMEGLRQFLDTFGITLPQSDRLHPRDFARVLEKVRGTPEERLVNEAVLRGQSQAAYSPDNLGHFGLALPRYAHFTSPIRRYADLLVHRALIRGLKLGKDGLTEDEAARFPDTAEHITSTERRAAAAERDAVDRYLAAFMAQRVGESFEARISGVTRFGLFVTLEENGASGIVPLGSLPDDRWDLDEATQSLAGRRTRLIFRLGDAVEARLAEATPRTGGMVFHLMQGLPSRGRGRPAPKGKQRGRRR